MNCLSCGSVEYLVNFGKPETKDIVVENLFSTDYCLFCIKNKLTKLFGENYIEVFQTLNEFEDAKTEYIHRSATLEFKVKELLTEKNGKKFTRDYFAENE